MMASGGRVDRIAAEYGVHFISRDKTVTLPSQSKARRTCQKILRIHGPDHLRHVFGLIDNGKNRGNWQARCITAVSWLLINKPEMVQRADFLELFDRLDLGSLLERAKRTNPKAPTLTMTVLLSDELHEMVEQKKDQAA